MNIQYAIANDIVYILEANPRASRTVPLVSKVVGLNMARVATQVMLGKKLKDCVPLERIKIPHVGVKESVFPFNMFPEVDPVLGPEMKSTGEVLGIADNFALAFYKAEEAAGMKMPLKGNILLTVNDKDKNDIIALARQLDQLGYKIFATEGTAKFLTQNKIAANRILKMHEGHPNIVDEITNGKIHMIINTPAGRDSKIDDSYIRIAAIKHKIPYITTTAAAKAAVEGVAAARDASKGIKSLQEYHGDIKKMSQKPEARHAGASRG
jgi:carbamoyl-phosphate synthase large subunit